MPDNRKPEKLIVDDKISIILDAFIEESEECLDTVVDHLLQLEKNPEDPECVNAVFRELHTIKGNSMGFELNELTRLVHKTEDVVRAWKDNEIAPKPDAIDTVLRSTDILRSFLEDAKNRIVSHRDISPLLSELETEVKLTGASPDQPIPEKQEPEPDMGNLNFDFLDEPPAPAESPEEELPKAEILPEKKREKKKMEVSDKIAVILDAFVEESEECLETIVQDLLQLEKNGGDKESIKAVFRELHTIKGNSMGFDLKQLTHLVHKAEDVVRAWKDTAVSAKPEEVDLILRSTDTLRSLLMDARNRVISDRNISSLIAELEITAERISSPPAEAGSPGTSSKREKLVLIPEIEEVIPDFLNESQELIERLDESILLLERNGPEEEIINPLFRSFHTFKGLSGALGFNLLQTLAHQSEDVVRKIRDEKMEVVPEVIQVLIKAVDTVRIIVVDIANRVTTQLDISPLLEELQLVYEENYQKLRKVRKKVPDAPAAQVPRPVSASSTIRVELTKLDRLSDSAGELILARNKLLDFAQRMERGTLDENPDEFLDAYNAELGMLTSDVKDMIMKSRMQPIQRVFSKYPRIVRDLSRELNKEIELVLKGQDTELDNSIIEEIGDPLIHLVRNSCDHGIEGPEEREKRGKPRGGTICLSAFYEDNFAVIKIEDDGKGIDEEVIKKKGLERGLITEQQAADMSKTKVLGLIFEAGFSTAAQVTSVSGRGVGMDVVKTKIQKLKGSVELDSEKGAGTTVTVRLPLTLAVMKVLEIKSEEQRFLIPVENIRETVLLQAEEAEILLLEGVYRFRKKEELPVIPLGKVLKIPETEENKASANYLVILTNQKQSIALLVDNIIQQHDVLIKPLGKFLDHFDIIGITGATLMGDGSVALILDNKRIIKERFSVINT